MNIIQKIKKLLKIKNNRKKIESIEKYEDVNAFLKYNLKNKYISSDKYGKYFTFITSNNTKCEIFREPLLNKIYYIDDYREPYIRTFIWEHRDEINAQLLRDKIEESKKNDEISRKNDIENKIKKAK